MKIIESYQPEFEKAIEFLRKDIQGLRTSRVTSELVNHILVEAYGTKTPLEQLATINIPEPRTIIIQPWDRNVLKEIEHALSNVDLGTSPIIQEGFIRLVMPPLNEETRKSLVKVLHAKLENARKSVRLIRDAARDKIVKAERNKEIGEDEKYRGFEELDKMATKYQDEIKSIGERKEKEITSI